MYEEYHTILIYKQNLTNNPRESSSSSVRFYPSSESLQSWPPASSGWRCSPRALLSFLWPLVRTSQHSLHSRALLLSLSLPSTRLCQAVSSRRRRWNRLSLVLLLLPLSRACRPSLSALLPPLSRLPSRHTATTSEAPPRSLRSSSLSPSTAPTSPSALLLSRLQAPTRLATRPSLALLAATSSPDKRLLALSSTSRASRTTTASDPSLSPITMAVDFAPSAAQTLAAP